VVTAGGIGGLLGAVGTGPLCRRLGPLQVVTFCSAASGIALILIGTATSMPVALARNLLYSCAIIGASVTMRSLRQVLVPRELLGRVTASWRLGGQAVTLIGAILAGGAAALLGNDPRPVFAGAGCLTLVTVAAAWFAGLQKAPMTEVADQLGGRGVRSPYRPDRGRRVISTAVLAGQAVAKSVGSTRIRMASCGHDDRSGPVGRA
jgi:MFS family permease